MTRSLTMMPACKAVVMIAAAALLGCGDGVSAPAIVEDSPLKVGVVVSRPLTQAVPPVAPAAASRGVAAVSLAEPGVYVSLLPGTVPDGVDATITNTRTGSIAVTSIVGGGFDPTPISAAAGDTLEIAVSRTSNVVMIADIVVDADADVRVVRTRPPQGQTDVPVNTSITVVFSEPIAAASVTNSSVTLFDGSSLVPGTAQVQPGAAYVVEFIPAAVLAGGVQYQLAVQSSVTGLDGTPLQTGLTTSFTTAPAPLTVGTVRIATTTTGDAPDPDGFFARVWMGIESVLTPVPVNGTVDIVVPVRDNYAIELSGFAENCVVHDLATLGVTRIVDVAPGATAVASFAITCERLPVTPLEPGAQLAFVRNGQIHVVNSDGSGIVRLTDGPNDSYPKWSPDGQRIAFARGTFATGTDIYIMNADGSNVVRRTSGGYNSAPSWSPDGSRIAFSALRDGSMNVYTMNTSDDGAADVVVVARPGWDDYAAWSPDGSRIALSSDWAYYDFATDIYVASPDGAQITQLTQGLEPIGTSGGGFLYFHPAWSPDGTRIVATKCPVAYTNCGSTALIVMNADGSGETASAFGGHSPAWSPDGLTIAFHSASGIRWVRADGSAQGLIIADGYSPAWRPAIPAAAIAK